MKEELHLFIIWEHGRDKQKEILEEFANVSGEEISHVKTGFFDKVKESLNK